MEAYIKNLRRNYSEYKEIGSEAVDYILNDCYFTALERTLQTKKKCERFLLSRNSNNINENITKLSKSQKMRYSIKTNLPQDSTLHAEIDEASDDEVIQLIRECSIAGGFRSSFVLASYFVNLVGVRTVREYADKTGDIFNRYSESSKQTSTKKDFLVMLVAYGYFIDKEETYRVKSLIKKIRNKNLTKKVRLLDLFKFENLLRREMKFVIPAPIIREDKKIIEKLYAVASREIESVVKIYRRVENGEARQNKYWR